MASLCSDDTVSSATAGAHRLLEGPSTDLIQADGERVQRMTFGILQVKELGLQIAPLRQQKLRPVAAFPLDVGLTEPAGSHQMQKWRLVMRLTRGLIEQ